MCTRVLLLYMRCAQVFCYFTWNLHKCFVTLYEMCTCFVTLYEMYTSVLLLYMKCAQVICYFIWNVHKCPVALHEICTSVPLFYMKYARVFCYFTWNVHKSFVTLYEIQCLTGLYISIWHPTVDTPTIQQALRDYGCTGMKSLKICDLDYRASIADKWSWLWRSWSWWIWSTGGISDRGIKKYKKEICAISLFFQHESHTDRSRREPQHRRRRAIGHPPEQATARPDRTRKREYRMASQDTCGTITRQFGAQLWEKATLTVQAAIAGHADCEMNRRQNTSSDFTAGTAQCQWPILAPRALKAGRKDTTRTSV